jgi:iron complex transport system substrate-binding protein
MKNMNSEDACKAEETATAIIAAALQIHRGIGPGLLETVYETLLGDRLTGSGLCVERQKRVSIKIDGRTFSEAFRIDLLVNKCVVVELKSCETLLPVHTKQLLTYLRLTELGLGLLINFGGPTLKSGLKRIVNNFAASSPSRHRVNSNKDETNESVQTDPQNPLGALW